MTRRDFIKVGGVATLTTVMSRSLEASESKPSLRRLRIAQIGVAHSHAPGKWAALKKYSQVFDLAGICEPSAKLQAGAAGQKDYADVRWLTEQELWTEKLDAVVVETDLPELLAVGSKALENGWHVHLDKPPGANLAEFTALQTLAAARQRIVQTGYMFRYHPAFRFCLDAVRQGWLGRVISIYGDIGSDIALERRADLAKIYGGSMLLLGSHLIDITMAILGEPKKVSATRNRSYPERDNYSDNEVVVLDYGNASATVRCLTAEFNPAKRRQFCVFGENGNVEIMPLEPGKVKLSLRQPAGGFTAGEHAVDIPAVTGRYDEMMLDFARQVRGEPSVVPQFDAKHELAVQRVTLECAGRL